MKQNIFIINLLFISNVLLSQVGIGTTTPTKDLDVNGELRVRNLPTQSANTSNLLTTDVDGNIGQSSFFLPSSVVSSVATSNIDRVVAGQRTINNIDLGLSTTVIIPANQEAVLIINYSVPIGISSFSEPLGYYGIRFLKDNMEAVAGSRKFSCNNNSTLVNANMITISNLYTESFQSEPTERIITYTLNGYIEQTSGAGGPHTYRFNMWSPTGANFNWGRATITHQVFIN